MGGEFLSGFSFLFLTKVAYDNWNPSIPVQVS